MTVMAAEAGASAFEAEAADATTVGRRTTGPRRTGGRTQQGTSRSRRASTAAPARPDRPEGSQRRGGQSKNRGPGFTGIKPATFTANYHGAVLAEFVLAVLLVAATPFARKGKQGVSPYVGKDMIQLLAITVLYFLLALIAGTGKNQARLAAWFGGLILLTVGLGEASTLASAVARFINPPATTGAPGETGTGQAPGTTTAGGRGSGGALEPATGLSRSIGQELRTPGATN